jgi:DNA-binding IclR family transcriptional regulator
MRGKVIAGLSISGPVDRMEPIERNQAVISNVTQTARNISIMLGYSSGA